MKIPKIRQLPSGAWFCQLRLDGQSISITDDDPDVVTAKAYAYKAGVLKARKSTEDITVGEALTKYINLRNNVVSPSTLRGYITIKNNRFLSLQHRKLSTLSLNTIQRAINDEATFCSPKTLRNAYMLISSAIAEAGGERYDVRLPQAPPKQKLYLTPKQIPILLNAAKGQKYEIPILLGLWSCRRSEIFGLLWDDVNLNKRTIRICRAIVSDKNHKFIEKPMPKNKSSVRTIPICDQLYDALIAVEDKTGRVVKAYPNSLYHAVNRICKKEGLPQIGTHGLRHSFASLAYHLGLPAKTAMRIGGWSTDDVMLRIYTHISNDDVGEAAAALTQFFDNTNANKNANES